MLFVTTGGTIDKLPVLLPDGTFDNESKIFGKTHIPEMLKKLHYLGGYSIKSLFEVDSLDMTDEHRDAIRVAIAESDAERIIITHGTDTMPETARYLEQQSELADRTITLTGAMIPYSMGESSDALVNLRGAITYTQILSSGVYVFMNGQAFDASNVQKDKTVGVFKTLD